MLQGPGILIIDRQSAKVFVKLDVTPQAFFRPHHAGPCARVTGKVEGDHGNLEMDRSHPEQKGLRGLDTLDPPDRVGQTDPPRQNRLLRAR
jgi:hypothetical protein